MSSAVVFGSLPIATKIVNFLEHNGHEVMVVLGNENAHNNDPWPNVPMLKDYCDKNKIRVHKLEEIAAFDDNMFDIGLSCRYSRIISGEVIRKFRYGVINMHGGVLPEFGGVYSVNHEILNGSKLGGGTLHYINDGIDTGDIVRECYFEITSNDTAYTVFQRTQIELEKGMREVVPFAIKGWLKGVSQADLVTSGRVKQYFSKSSLAGKKLIRREDLFTEKADRTIRAFDFPGYEPAYVLDDLGRKIYIRYTI